MYNTAVDMDIKAKREFSLYRKRNKKQGSLPLIFPQVQCSFLPSSSELQRMSFLLAGIGDECLVNDNEACGKKKPLAQKYYVCTLE